MDNKTMEVKLKEIFAIFLGFLLITFVFWNRFIRTRLPIEIINYNFYIIICFVVISLSLFLYYLRKFFKSNKGYPLLIKVFKRILSYPRLAKKIDTILIVVEYYIIKSPKNFYLRVIRENFNIAYIIEKPTMYLLTLFAKKPKNKIYILLIMVPRIIIATIFILELILYKQLNIFLSSLYILIIPLITKCYLYMADDLADLNLKFLTSHLTFDLSTSIGYRSVSFRTEIPNIEGAIDIVRNRQNKELLFWFVSNFDIYRNIKSFVQRIYEAQDKYSVYENLYVYACYTTGWSYILIFLLST